MENNNTACKVVVRSTDEDETFQDCGRSHSSSSLTDSLDADDHNVRQMETENCKPKKAASRLPVKTKPPVSDHAEHSAFACLNNSNNSNNSSCHDTREQNVSKLFRRDCSLTECTSSTQHGLTKEPVVSRLTTEKVHCHGNEADYDEYLTPTQRKGMTIRDLKKQVKDLEGQIDGKDCEIENLKKRIEQEVDLRTKEVKEIKEQLVALEVKYGALTLSYEESVKEVDTLETTLFEMKERDVEKDLHHKNMYLEMYEKGKECARFERENELEMLVKSGKEQVSLEEVYKKLTQSQSDLAKWQSLRRVEMYEVAERPKTEAESTLQFLKDSFFHFLTNGKDSDDCLRAIVEIFNFTDVQKKKINKMLIWKKKS